jgi:hypothetical protein
MANQEPKKFDRVQYEADLNQFNEDLWAHVWSFQCDNYADYMTALKKEPEFGRRAEMLGKQGVDLHRWAIKRKHELHVRQTLKAEMQPELDRLRSEIESQKAEILRVKMKYMRPVDLFEAELERHDWFYDYSDDNNTYRAGKTAEKRLLQTAKEGGVDFQNVIVALWNKKYDGQKSTWSDLEAKIRA